MPRGGGFGGGMGGGRLGGPPLFRGGGVRGAGCFGGLFGPMIAGVLGFMFGRSLSSRDSARPDSYREDDLRRREEDLRRREEELRRRDDAQRPGP